MQPFLNPFRPGAGQQPPHLAGRIKEKELFNDLLAQDVIMKNLIITGLRGTGKTVLLDSLKPVAVQQNWLWTGTDLSESASVSEDTIAVRLLTDLSILTSGLLQLPKKKAGFTADFENPNISPFDYSIIQDYYNSQPGLVADKLKTTLEFVWENLKIAGSIKGIVFAYDEAQKMSDKREDGQYPLSVLLEVFQSLQKRNFPFLLVFAGLPTLHQRLVNARTYSERMFTTVELQGLSEKEGQDAILKPIQKEGCPVSFNEKSVDLIVRESGGYPYFVQFMCREAFDSFLNQYAQKIVSPSVPLREIVAKLDIDFFSARWNDATDRERDLLSVISNLDNSQTEFTVKEVVEKAGETLINPIGASQVSQMFSKLIDDGMIYRTRHGKYRLGIPLLDRFIKRQNIQSVQAF